MNKGYVYYLTNYRRTTIYIGVISDAIARKMQLKNWHKEWKWNLVKEFNPTLEDWYETLRG